LVTNEVKEQLCRCKWKKTTTAGPSVEVTMKAASQRFSTRASFNPIWHILSKWVPHL